MALTWYRHFQRNGGLNQIYKPSIINIPALCLSNYVIPAEAHAHNQYLAHAHVE
jgi:hypothetical protein